MSRPRKQTKVLTVAESTYVTRKKLAEKLEFYQDCVNFVERLESKTADQLSWLMWANARINTLQLELC
jgi:hypothetical protein